MRRAKKQFSVIHQSFDKGIFQKKHTGILMSHANNKDMSFPYETYISTKNRFSILRRQNHG